MLNKDYIITDTKEVIVLSRYIPENVERRLYAESMGRCMNPACRKELFSLQGDIIERAHIDPYCKTADNSFENLVVLCPNCHTNFDKNKAFSPEEVLSWKQVMQQELKSFFGKRFDSFDELQEKIKPLLTANKMVYEQYYLGDNKTLWDRFEIRVVINNRIIREMLSNNLGLFQSNNDPQKSNIRIIEKYLQHIDEFELTRGTDEKVRKVLFPKEVDSIFGIAPVDEGLFPSTESLEAFVDSLSERGISYDVNLIAEKPYVSLIKNETRETVYLSDLPRLRQLYYDNNSFRKTGVRLDSLIFALRYANRQGVRFNYVKANEFRTIIINKTKVYYVYEYCLSEVDLRNLCPEEDSVVVNLHNWNGDGCISGNANLFAKKIGVKLLTMDKYYDYIKSQRQNS